MSVYAKAIPLKPLENLGFRATEPAPYSAWIGVCREDCLYPKGRVFERKKVVSVQVFRVFGRGYKRNGALGKHEFTLLYLTS